MEIAKRFSNPVDPVMVDSAPCQDVVYKDDEVDLTKFPLFHHHPKDGQAYLNDTNVVSRNPENGLIDQGIYRFMYRSKNETNVDMRNATHRARIAAKDYAAKGKDMPITVLIGGPTLDKLASMMSNPDSDDWAVMGGFYKEPCKLVKCLTNDLTIPANAEIVLEGRIITSEGWVHDEGPYGEYTGTYGGGLPHNNRFVVDCITHRKDAIYQYATIGGLHPGRTDMSAFQPAIEGDLHAALIKQAFWCRTCTCPRQDAPISAMLASRRGRVAMRSRRWLLCSPAPGSGCPRRLTSSTKILIYNDERVK